MRYTEHRRCRMGARRFYVHVCVRTDDEKHVLLFKPQPLTAGAESELRLSECAARQLLQGMGEQAKTNKRRREAHCEGRQTSNNKNRHYICPHNILHGVVGQQRLPTTRPPSNTKHPRAWSRPRPSYSA